MVTSPLQRLDERPVAWSARAKQWQNAAAPTARNFRISVGCISNAEAERP